MASRDLGILHGLAVEVVGFDGSAATVTVEGEVDITNADTLRTVLTFLCEGVAAEIELDMAQVSFMDSTGLRALAVLVRNARHCHPKVTGASPAVRQLLTAAGMSMVLRLQ